MPKEDSSKKVNTEHISYKERLDIFLSQVDSVYSDWIKNLDIHSEAAFKAFIMETLTIDKKGQRLKDLKHLIEAESLLIKKENLTDSRELSIINNLIEQTAMLQFLEGLNPQILKSEYQARLFFPRFLEYINNLETDNKIVENLKAPTTFQNVYELIPEEYIKLIGADNKLNFISWLQKIFDLFEKYDLAESLLFQHITAIVYLCQHEVRLAKNVKPENAVDRRILAGNLDKQSSDYGINLQIFFPEIMKFLKENPF